MPPKPKLPVWQVGDAVYSLLLDPATALYRVRGVGRIVRIEGAMLHLATKRGPRTWGATDWPAFKSRADAEAYIREKPGPDRNSRPMAGHGPSSTAPATEQWECLRCEQIRDGYVPTVPEHSPRCTYRGVGRDPERGG